MKSRILLFSLIILSFAFPSHAQNRNPYQSIGKKGKVITLTQGRYEESFDDDSIQQIGTALVNVRTMQIVKLELSKEEQRVIDETAVSRFLSVDPLTKNFAMLSPYQYASNTPIQAIDLDGLESLYYLKGEQAKYHAQLLFQLNKPSPLTKGMTDVQVYQLAFQSFISSNKEPIRTDQYIDKRYADAQRQVNYFFSHQVPAYSKSDAATAVAHSAISIGLMNGDNSAVTQIQKTDDFLYKQNLAPIVAPPAAEGTVALLEISETAPLSVTMGRLKNDGASQATAAKVGAPFYSEWKDLGIYNPKDFVGWGDAFKFITNKVIKSGGTIHFELKGLNVGDALAGDATQWVARYTAWELQQVTSSSKLFQNKEFYLNSVRQTTEQLEKMGIKPPKE